MIVLRNLTKTFTINGRRQTVADNLNTVFPTGAAVGLLGRNGAGKSTLLKLIAGTSTPTWGEVLSTGTVSFPVGLASSLHGDLTGAQNTRFVARIYGADTDALMGWVEDFAELGQHFHLPVRSYSSGMKARLSFGINMGLAFDTYLIDEITAVGDASFKRKSSEVFKSRMETAGAIFVSHSMGQVRDLCTAGALLEDGHLTYYEDIEDAIDRYMFSLDPDRTHEAAALKEREEIEISLPKGVRLLYGLGLPATHADWLSDCFRRHRQCLCPDIGGLHYFDIRAGRSAKILRDRQQRLGELVTNLPGTTGGARRKTLSKIAEANALLQVHAAQPDGPDRHDTYLNFMQRHRRSQPLLCDLTPSYARLRRADYAEMAALGESIFVVVLRDPVDRLWEALCLDRPPEARSQESCLAQLETLLQSSAEDLLTLKPDADYERLFTRLGPEVPEGRLKILFHEDLDREDRRFEGLRSLTAALGLEDLPEERRPAFPPPADIPELPADIAGRLEEKLAQQYTAMRTRFGPNLPAEWRRREATARAAK